MLNIMEPQATNYTHMQVENLVDSIKIVKKELTPFTNPIC